MFRRIARPSALRVMPLRSTPALLLPVVPLRALNVQRRPQLTEEQRAKVVVNQSEWPEEFKDYDPQNPYKNTPDYIDGMSSWSYLLWGSEMAFLWIFWGCVFPYAI